MAEALVRRRWSGCKIKSVGTDVQVDGDEVASEAVEVMKRRGLDITSHKKTSLREIDYSNYEIVISFSKGITRKLTEEYNISSQKIVEVLVADPRGIGTMEQYDRCANEINRRIFGEIERHLLGGPAERQ